MEISKHVTMYSKSALAQYKDANFQNLLIVMNVVSYIYNMHNSTSNEKNFLNV